MSEVASRSPAARGGRGSVRGGRGGYSSRGGRNAAAKTSKSAAAAVEDQGEIGQLKIKYFDSLNTIKEIFPHFTDEDIVVALDENGGDLETTINKITSGAVSQWEEAPTKKEKTKPSKSHDTADAPHAHANTKAARGRGGSEATRGSRGRATERGGRGANRAVSKAATQKPTTTTAVQGDAGAAGALDPSDVHNGTDVTASATPTTWNVVGSSQNTDKASAPVSAATEPEKATVKSNGTRSWADLMKPAPKPKVAPIEKQAPAPGPSAQAHDHIVRESQPDPLVDAKLPVPVPPIEPAEQVPPTKSPSLPPSDPVANIAPSEDKLTEENLEQVKDVSQPVATDTVASTVGTEDPRSAIATPLRSQQPSGKHPIGGFATTALKATQGGAKAGFQRKVKEQQEAVVMPGNHAVDRTAVQFGSLGLGGTEDIDDDREQAETRAQPPQHSPIAPRASLPSAPQAHAGGDLAPAPRPAPGLTADLHNNNPAAVIESQQGQATTAYDQFSNRFGGLPASQAPGLSNVTKPYEPFGQQLSGATSHPFDNSYGAHSQAPGQQAQNAPSYLGGFGDNQYGSYDYQRNPVYGGFGQQPGQTSQDHASGQRASSGFGTSAADVPSQYSTSHAGQSRFATAGESLNSGHSTPAPAAQSAQSQGQTHGQSNHLASQSQGGAQAPYANYYGAGYNNAFYNQQLGAHTHHQPYGRDRPAFDDARRYEDSFAGQSQHYGYGYGSYGASPYGNKYGGPSQYGISPQANYDNHGASPANTFGRDTTSGGFGGYGRNSSAHPESSQQNQHTASSAYAGMADSFGRNSSAFGVQGSQQHAQQASNDESSRYGTDSSKIPAGGPSPAPNQQRPGSAANTAQAGPGGQPQGQAYSGYPHSGLGGFGSHQGGAGGHHSGYGNYGGGFGGPYYGGGRGNTWGYGTS